MSSRTSSASATLSMKSGASSVASNGWSAANVAGQGRCTDGADQRPRRANAVRLARLAVRDLGVRLSPHATHDVLSESDRLDHAAPWLFPTVVFCTVFWLNRING
jgi:hypothetical protein